jgi:hypothetical protein
MERGAPVVLPALLGLLQDHIAAGLACTIILASNNSSPTQFIASYPRRIAGLGFP